MAGPATLYQTGDHASRPANGSGCVLYACTTHNLVYRDDGTSWTTLITLTSGMTNPMTTAGDIVTGGASGTPTRLGIGAALQHLRVNAGATALEYADPPSSSGGNDPLGFGFPFTADPGLANASGQAVNMNVTRYMRVIGGGAITKVGMHITASSGNISVAHYSPSGSGRSAVPGTRVATTGAIASPGTGWREIALATTLSPGDFLAVSADNNTFAILAAGGFFSAASAIAAGRNYAQGSAHPAPSPAGTVDAGNPITYILVGVA